MRKTKKNKQVKIIYSSNFSELQILTISENAMFHFTVEDGILVYLYVFHNIGIVLFWSSGWI